MPDFVMHQVWLYAEKNFFLYFFIAIDDCFAFENHSHAQWKRSQAIVLALNVQEVGVLRLAAWKAIKYNMVRSSIGSF